MEGLHLQGDEFTTLDVICDESFLYGRPPSVNLTTLVNPKIVKIASVLKRNANLYKPKSFKVSKIFSERRKKAVTLIIKPEIVRIVSETSPVHGIYHEYRAFHKRIFGQRIGPQSSHVVDRTPSRQPTEVRQNKWRWYKQKNRRPILCPSCWNPTLLLGTVSHPHAEQFDILSVREQSLTIILTRLERNYLYPVGTIAAEVEVVQIL